MKRDITRFLSKIAAAIALGVLAAGAQAQNLAFNGDFSEQKSGTQVSISSSVGGQVHDRDVFSAWRFFSVGNPSIANFTATIIPNPDSAGNLAMRLDYDNTGASAGTDWGLDRWNSRIPVTYGTGYTISFDAAHISGGTTLEFSVREIVNDAIVAQPYSQNVVVSDVNYRHYAFNYTPSVPNVTLDVRFKPLDTDAEKTLSISLDNFSITPLGCLNGSFEAQAAGTLASSGGGDIIDGGTFSNWRFFSVGTPAGSVSTGTIVTDATDHNVGFRYDVDIANGSPADYALDKDNSKVPVAFGTRYKVSFDAAHLSGGTFLSFGIGEHRSDGSWTGRGTDIPLEITNPSYQTYSFFWTPLDSSTALANLAFRVRPTGGLTTASMLFDNVRLERAVAPVTLGNLLQAYDGTAKSVSVATEPPGLAVGLTYDGSPSAPSGLGSYTVIATVQDLRYEPTCVTNTLLIVTSPALIPDGSFEAQTLDATATVEAGNVVDNATFAPWRIYNVAPGSETSFTGTVVSAASDGAKAMRLDVSNPELLNAFYAFDRAEPGTLIRVTPGARYLFVFDAARLSGTSKLRVMVPEFNDSHGYLGQQREFFFELAGTHYQTLSFIWAPLDSSAAQVSLAFSPWCVPTSTTGSIALDNVRLTPLGEVSLRGLTQAYDGTPKSVSAITDPPGLPVSLTYNGSAAAPSNGGVYTVVATVTNTLYACSKTGTLLIKDAAVPQLKTNGSFEAQPVGTSLSIGPEGGVFGSVFSNWRFFSVGGPAIANFTATIVDSATEGGLGMRLSQNNTGGAGSDHALDADNAKMPVAYGVRYKVSFDAAWEEGSRQLDVGIAEFDSAGNYLGEGTGYQPLVSSTNYQNFSYIWTPKSPLVALANFAFRQQNIGYFNTSVMRFDNVRIDPLVATVSLTHMEHAFNDPSKLPSAVTSPGGLPVSFTYDGSETAPTAPGRYTVVGTVSDGYFTGSSTGTLVLHGPLGTMLILN